MRKWMAASILAASILMAQGVVAETLQAVDRIVAVVNDDVITESELEEQIGNIKRQLAQQGARLPTEQVLRDQMLERMVITQLQTQLAARYGIRIDDETLERSLNNIAKQNGMDLDKFRNVLESEGYVFARFREDIRKEMLTGRLRAREVDNRVMITDQEVDNFLTTQATQGSALDEFQLAHILIAVPEAATPESIAEARKHAERVLAELRAGADFAQMAISHSAGQQALEGGDLGWRKPGQMPTLFADVVLKLKPGEVSDLIRSPSGFHIIKLVNKRTQQEERSIVHQNKARHILIRTGDTVSSSEARMRLQRLRERIENGESFTELAHAHSEDTGSAADGGNLGWASPGMMVPEFEQVMNKIAIDAVSEPFQSQFGWHILQVQERRDYDNTAELRRSRAREQLRQRRIEEDTQQWLRRLRDEAFVEVRGDIAK